MMSSWPHAIVQVISSNSRNNVWDWQTACTFYNDGIIDNLFMEGLYHYQAACALQGLALKILVKANLISGRRQDGVLMVSRISGISSKY